MFFLSRNPNDPRRMKMHEDKKPPGDHVTGSPGHDGFSRLSQADRETGHRPQVGMTPQPYGRYPTD